MIARWAGRMICAEKGHSSPVIEIRAAPQCAEVTVVSMCLRCGAPIQQVCLPEETPSLQAVK